MEYQVQKIERKVARQILLRDEMATRRRGFAQRPALSAQASQERLYSILPLLAEHGPDTRRRKCTSTSNSIAPTTNWSSCDVTC